MPIAAPAGMLDRVLEKHGVERVAGPHCFAFYQGNAAFEAIAEDDMTSFYMTDFLCRQFDAFFMKPLKLDKHPELIKDFFGNYEKVVYLAQTDDPELDRVAENAAKLLGLAYERRSTGYGDLTPALAEAASLSQLARSSKPRCPASPASTSAKLVRQTKPSLSRARDAS